MTGVTASAFCSGRAWSVHSLSISHDRLTCQLYFGTVLNPTDLESAPLFLDSDVDLIYSTLQGYSAFSAGLALATRSDALTLFDARF